MFFILLRKEMLDHTRSLRFTLGWLLLLILLLGAAVLQSTDVQARLEKSSLMERAKEDYLSKYAHTNRVRYFIQPSRPIEKSEILVRGLENPEQSNSFFEDPLAGLFASFDLLTIVSLLVTLLAIVFTYDGICGEREAGTLKMVHTGAVSRAQFLLAKWAGAIIVLFVPLVCSLAVALLVGAGIAGIGIDGGMLADFGFISVAALLLIAFFTALGLLISASVRLPGTSILVLLFIWTVFVLAIPSVSPLLAAQLSPIESVNAVERQARLLTDTIRDNRLVEEDNKVIARYRNEYQLPANLDRIRGPETFTALGWDEARATEVAEAYAREWRAMLDRVNGEQRDKANALRDELERQIERQENLAGLLSLLSPVSSFTRFGAEMASVGAVAEMHYEEESSHFYEELEVFIKTRQAELESKLGRRLGFEEFFDMSGYPRFRHQVRDLGSRIADGSGYLGLLAGYALVCLLWAVIAYRRYDIR